MQKLFGVGLLTLAFCLTTGCQQSSEEVQAAAAGAETKTAQVKTASIKTKDQFLATLSDEQRAINDRLRAELRADPLLRFAPLLDPTFVPAGEVTHLSDDDHVFVVAANGIVKAYPTHFVAWHHVIHDDFGGTPVLATWCALCGTGAAYRNSVNGEPSTFRMTGGVGSNVAFADVATETTWQQATGEAVEGPLTGQYLQRVNALETTFGELCADHPEALVMLPHPGLEENYAHYKPQLATANERFRGSATEDPRRPRHDRIMGLEVSGGYKAYPLKELAMQPLINDTVGESPVLVTYAVDTKTSRAFSRVVDGQTLTFSKTGSGELTDQETSSHWSRTGRAIAGPLEGAQLVELPPLPSFWFSWAQFNPETEVFIAR